MSNYLAYTNKIAPLLQIDKSLTYHKIDML